MKRDPDGTRDCPHACIRAEPSARSVRSGEKAIAMKTGKGMVVKEKYM